MKASSIARALAHAFEINRPVFIWGPPGCGKSDVVHQVAETRGAELRDVRMNLLDPIDIKGFPVPDVQAGEMKWLPADFLPPMKIKGKPNKSHGVLFLDEFNSAPPATQAAGYQLILNRKIGAYELPENWRIVAAGNRDGDRGVTHRMPSPLANRLIHLDFSLDLDDWCTWAVQNAIDTTVIAFLRFRSNQLHDFDAAKNPRAFPSPRSWSFVSQIISKNSLSAHEELEMLAGTVGEGAAGEFKAFRDTLKDMPNIDKILLTPDEVPVPTAPAIKYAVSTALAQRATSNNFDRVLKYADRMDPEFQVVLVRDALKRDASVGDTASFNKWAIANASALV